ncbi:MAG: bifunctional phosphoribosylaminoimidazolecarboxamide formyltransferase/IMP cyclohydrolase [Chloroflexota bacterium]
MPRALLSVYDKTGLVDFATELIALGWDLVASGGTQRRLEDAGLAVTPVEQLTGVAEMLGGRVKTLHPAIHAGILARDRAEDYDDLTSQGYAPISMVVCNLYPFQETVAKVGITLQDAIEQIDIGGVTLLRAAAKNFIRVASVCDPTDYAPIIAALQAGSDIDLATRRRLAIKTFAHTRNYDTAIHAFLSQDMTVGPATDTLPHHLSISATLNEEMRYGENPHQKAAYYAPSDSVGVLGGDLLGGKQLSYNNIMDVDAAWRAVSSFTEQTVVIVKHLNPTGIASHEDSAQAYRNALASDPVSAFGGIIGVNHTVTEAFVEAMESIFIEAIAAPGFTQDAIALLQSKRKNCRLLKLSQPYDSNEFDIRSVHRGVLVQQRDMGDPDGATLKTVTNRPPTDEELEALRFAWRSIQHVKSNAIVLAIPGATVGIGGGLSSRVDAAELAVKKAGERARGSVMASDAFFPFADGIQAGIDAGITAVIQPGGSIRDGEVIAAANEAGIAMVFTGVRHFRH